MSSPGQIAEPRMRPVSGMMSATGTPFSPPPGLNQPIKNFGQDYQFAETWANPPPEFVVGSGQPPAGEELSQADGAHENGQESYRKEAAVWVPPPEAPWYKKITFMQWAVSSICFVGTSAVIIAILAAMGKLGPQSSVLPTATAAYPSVVLTTTRAPDVSPSTSSSATMSTSTGTSTALSQPTSTAVIKDCSNTSSFHNSIEWVGADSGYNAAYDPANSAGECCNRCFLGDAGCVGWLYNATNKYTPCTKIMLKDDHPGADSKCPKGYAGLSLSSGGNGVAGVGPCSNDINIG